jgi:hypothetical protein
MPIANRISRLDLLFKHISPSTISRPVVAYRLQNIHPGSLTYSRSFGTDGNLRIAPKMAPVPELTLNDGKKVPLVCTLPDLLRNYSNRSSLGMALEQPEPP